MAIRRFTNELVPSTPLKAGVKAIVEQADAEIEAEEARRIGKILAGHIEKQSQRCVLFTKANIFTNDDRHYDEESLVLDSLQRACDDYFSEARKKKTTSRFHIRHQLSVAEKLEMRIAEM